MVQVLYYPAQPQSGSLARDDAKVHSPGKTFSREEHAQLMRDLAIKRGMRAPRRGWSLSDHQSANDSVHSHPLTERRHAAQESTLGSVAETPSAPGTPVIEKSLNQVLAQIAPVQIPARPKLPTPRRSYSVQDYEPLPPCQPKPSARMTILDLPSELHYALLDFLDPIDGVCFGLAHSNLHAIAKRKYGTKISLASRYEGPNDMEWAWRGAGPLVRSNSEALTREGSEKLRPKGQVYCRKCGIHRCELHRHLRQWMGEGREYCEIKKAFGAPAGEDAKTYCFMSSPKNPGRCGRHGPKRMGNAA